MTEKEVAEITAKQIVYIATYGCSKIKCKHCSLKNIHKDRAPDTAREFAKAFIQHELNKGKTNATVE